MTDENTVMVQAVRSFAGEEGDKGPASEPFVVSRQRYADLKANGLVELAEPEKAEPAEPAEPAADGKTKKK